MLTLQQGKTLMTDALDYGNIMNRAMRVFVKDVLQQVADNGLPGEHHFFITVNTQHPDVEIAKWLIMRYPDEITIVMQNWFENLDVQDDGFYVTLNFGDTPEPLYIPYAAIITFVDPSVEFGVRFETIEASEDDKPSLATVEQEPEPTSPQHKGDAEVVSLDSFRK